MSASYKPESKRVLSIQSTVVSGYVGNKAATFPLQLLGWEVDVLNTVQFSNHTGYGRFGGSKFDSTHLDSIFSALEANGLLRQSHLLTGYTPSPSSLLSVKSLLTTLSTINPSLTYILDPVMGDDGRLYVSPDVIPIYKSLLPFATICTPNWFEAQVLTDDKIVDGGSLVRVIKKLRVMGVKGAVITSVTLPHSEIDQLLSISDSGTSLSSLGLSDSSVLLTACSSPLGTYIIPYPSLPEHYEGVGDVFSSLICAHSSSSLPLHEIVEIAVGSLQGILRNTRKEAIKRMKEEGGEVVGKEGEGEEERIRRLKNVELRLVQSQKEILEPERKWRGWKISD